MFYPFFDLRIDRFSKYECSIHEITLRFRLGVPCEFGFICGWNFSTASLGQKLKFDAREDEL